MGESGFITLVVSITFIAGLVVYVLSDVEKEGNFCTVGNYGKRFCYE